MTGIAFKFDGGWFIEWNKSPLSTKFLILEKLPLFEADKHSLSNGMIVNFEKISHSNKEWAKITNNSHIDTVKLTDQDRELIY